MIDQWEEFTGGAAQPKEKRLHVSLNTKGQFLLNKNVLDALGNPEAVRLFFSETTKRIGIQAAEAITPHAFPVRPRVLAHSRMIHASPFCRNYGLKVKGTIAFNRIEINNEAMLILDLAHTSRVSRVS
ncbi:MAG: hypothetical protein QM785_00360 [Pyrinomonadaceae bacterium]